MIIILMGVCGSGKTTIGSSVAKKLGWQFADADEFHSEENKIKMSTGQPLTDQDRVPWLQSIHNFVRSLSKSGLVTCSALKKVYRDVLRYGDSYMLHLTSDHTAKNADVKNSNEENKQSQKDSDFNITQEEEVDIVFIHLTGSREVLETRLVSRLGHFMPAGLLQSQLDTLENLDHQENGFSVDIDKTEEGIVKEIISKLGV